jgi:uncharacterized damage-inducible protein DinB
MRTALRVSLFSLLAPALAALAEENPFSSHNRTMYAGIKSLLLKSAEKMPEDNYGFKPTDGVRTFGQIVGHAADAQYLFCSIALGEKNPAPKIEQGRTSKADLVAALKEAFAYCDKVYDGMTDASGTQTVKLFRQEMPKLGVLSVNNLHTTEHYGNLVVYLRMKNIVPPSSDPGFAIDPSKR